MLSTTGRRLAIAISAVLGSCVMAVSFGPAARAGAGALPDSLSTSAFWALSAELSEPNGYFQSDNLVSNEIQFQRVIPDLTKSARAGRVYLGVGPEQNFSYIAALKPAMVFIVDVRRGNLQLHLMYKALFELSTDRADFVSRLFSKKRPAGLTRGVDGTAGVDPYGPSGGRVDPYGPSSGGRASHAGYDDDEFDPRPGPGRGAGPMRPGPGGMAPGGMGPGPIGAGPMGPGPMGPGPGPMVGPGSYGSSADGSPAGPTPGGLRSGPPPRADPVAAMARAAAPVGVARVVPVARAVADRAILVADMAATAMTTTSTASSMATARVAAAGSTGSGCAGSGSVGVGPRTTTARPSSASAARPAGAT